MSDLLRQEIIESEKGRTDLLKWKLIVLGLVASLGLFESEGKLIPVIPVIYVLSVIPPAWAYIDLLCYHLLIRNIVIGTFERECRIEKGAIPGMSEAEQQAERYSKYELFVQSVSHFREECEDCKEKYSNTDSDDYLNKVMAAVEGECCHTPEQCPLFNKIGYSKLTALIDYRITCASSNDVKDQLKNWKKSLEASHGKTENAFGFENWILGFSTYWISCLVWICGITRSYTAIWDDDLLAGIVIMASSAASLVWVRVMQLRSSHIISELRYWVKHFDTPALVS